MLPTLPGYHPTELIDESPRYRVYRARRESDGIAVVVRVAIETQGSPVTRYEVAHDLAALTHPGIGGLDDDISHELRTPLNAILGRAQLLLMGEGLDEEQREGVQTMLRAGRHLHVLINRLLRPLERPAAAVVSPQPGDEADPIEPDLGPAPGREDLQALMDLLTEGALSTIRRRADELAKGDPALQSWVARLSSKARAFDDDGVERMLRAALQRDAMC